MEAEVVGNKQSAAFHCVVGSRVGAVVIILNIARIAASVVVASVVVVLQ